MCCSSGDTDEFEGIESILERYKNGEQIHICNELAKIQNQKERKLMQNQLLDLLFNSMKKLTYLEYKIQFKDSNLLKNEITKQLVQNELTKTQKKFLIEAPDPQ